MKGRPYNVGLDDANLSKLELCAVIKKHLPKFVFLEAPIGEDPDKRELHRVERAAGRDGVPD